MRVLLINPKEFDCLRAEKLFTAYMKEHYSKERKRPRNRPVIFAGPDYYKDPCAVWHSKNQVTIHFGDENE